MTHHVACTIYAKSKARGDWNNPPVGFLTPRKSFLGQSFAAGFASAFFGAGVVAAVSLFFASALPSVLPLVDAAESVEGAGVSPPGVAAPLAGRLSVLYQPDPLKTIPTG